MSMGDSGVTFRAAGAGDAAAVLEMMRAFYAEEGLVVGEGVERALRGLLADAGAGCVFVASSGTRAVGYGVLAFFYSVERGGRTGLLDELYIEPPHRGRGVGRAALAFALEQAREAECAGVVLEVSAKNARARALYERMGFRGLGREMLYREVGRDSGDAAAR
jgi:ribosomal protein S18 acetylase RimI-like enzyme